MSRWLIWAPDDHRKGWACSQCDWLYPLPDLLSDPEAKRAYDRLAAVKFENHDCAQHPRKIRLYDGQSFDERVQNLMKRGFKPKDAVDITLQEISLEMRDKPKLVEQARADAEDFLRRLRTGLF
jgi:hypothetical protein